MSADDRIEAYAQAIFKIASAEECAAECADELFRFARTFEGNDALRNALIDPAIPVERRQGVVADLLGSLALTTTTAIVWFLVTSGRVSALPAIIDRFVELVTESRDHELAEVRSAVPLSAEQQRRLAESLSRATRKNVEVRVVIDASVLGGIVARVGDTVIDGTVRNRLEQLREQI